jgi:hypothetical protein
LVAAKEDGKLVANRPVIAVIEYKRFDDAEFEIAGATIARGTDADCVVWQCATESGQTFEVVPAWPDDERPEAFVNAGSLIGRMLTVRFCGRTAAGLPRCAGGGRNARRGGGHAERCARPRNGTLPLVHQLG